MSISRDIEGSWMCVGVSVGVGGVVQESPELDIKFATVSFRCHLKSCDQSSSVNRREGV